VTNIILQSLVCKVLWHL